MSQYSLISKNAIQLTVEQHRCELGGLLILGFFSSFDKKQYCAVGQIHRSGATDTEDQLWDLSIPRVWCPCRHSGATAVSWCLTAVNPCDIKQKPLTAPLVLCNFSLPSLQLTVSSPVPSFIFTGFHHYHLSLSLTRKDLNLFESELTLQ